MNFDQLLNVSMRLGTMLLENGAEIYRVEESIRRMVLAYGAREVDVYAIPNTIIVTLMTTQHINLTKTKRIHDRTTNLDKVERLNHLCRQICQNTPDLNIVDAQLDEISKRPIYGFYAQLMAYAITSSMFTLFFGGEFVDAFWSFWIGPLLKITAYHLTKLRTNPFFTTILCSFLCGLLSNLICHFHLALHVDKMIIGLVMNLVPGVAITNSVRDIIAGDFIAGQTKMTEALLTATSIAVGTGIAFSISSSF